MGSRLEYDQILVRPFGVTEPSNEGSRKIGILLLQRF